LWGAGGAGGRRGGERTRRSETARRFFGCPVRLAVPLLPAFRPELTDVVGTLIWQDQIKSVFLRIIHCSFQEISVCVKKKGRIFLDITKNNFLPDILVSCWTDLVQNIM
jgi:hypothetical protein